MSTNRESNNAANYDKRRREALFAIQGMLASSFLPSDTKGGGALVQLAPSANPFERTTKQDRGRQIIRRVDGQLVRVGAFGFSPPLIYDCGIFLERCFVCLQLHGTLDLMPIREISGYEWSADGKRIGVALSVKSCKPSQKNKGVYLYDGGWFHLGDEQSFELLDIYKTFENFKDYAGTPARLPFIWKSYTAETKKVTSILVSDVGKDQFELSCIALFRKLQDFATRAFDNVMEAEGAR